MRTEAQRRATQKWRIKHKEYIKEYKRKQYLKYQEQEKEHSRKYRREHYGKKRLDNWLYAKISIDTYGQFLTLLAMTNYRCEICHISLTEKTACLDHDHNNGKVRGILCDWCNKGLGHFQDSLANLLKAVQYIEQ